MICAVCAARAQAVMPANTRRIFWRSVAWGATAAVGISLLMYLLGLLLMRGVGIWSVGTALIVTSLGAGYGIGKVMRKAAGRAGGLRYQIAAAVLVYCSISIAFGALVAGTGDVPFYALPFLVLAPLVWPFVGRGQEAGMVFAMLFVGIRWSWPQLKPWALKIVGPESLRATPAVGIDTSA